MSEMPDITSPDICELCGKPAIVHMTQERFEGPARMRHLCGDCADRHPFDGLSGDDDGLRATGSLAELMMLAGIGFTLMTLAADYFGIGDNPGFGGMQITGVILGVIFVILGAMFRSDLLTVAGGVLTVLACAADWLSLGGGASISRKQTAALMAAVAISLLGAWIHKRHRRASLVGKR